MLDSVTRTSRNSPNCRTPAWVGVFLSSLLLCNCGGTAAPLEVQAGDLVFQVSRSSQSAAIQAATGSRYSHVGIVFIVDGMPQVLEAVATVRSTPLDSWIARGENSHFVVKRLKNRDAILTPEVLESMRLVGEGMAGKPYDLKFGWSDDLINCSELVWKIYVRGAGVRVGMLERFADFNLEAPSVRAKLQERWAGALPLDEIVISPAAVLAADSLVEVGRR